MQRLLSLCLLAAGLLLAAPAWAQCTTSWQAAVSGTWNNIANWDSGIPTSGDNACIAVAGTYTVTLDVNATVNSLTLGGASGTQTLAVSTNSLTLSDSSSIGANGVLDWQAAQISGAGPLVNDGLIQIDGSATKDIGGGTTIRNQNLTTFDGTGSLRFLGGSGLIENAVGATFDILSDADFSIFNGGNTFDNDGLFRKSGGTDVSQVSQSGIDFDNSGTVEAQSGTIRFNGSGTHDMGTFTAASGAEVFFDAGTHTVVGSISGNPTGTVRMNAGATLSFTASTSLSSGGGADLDFGGTGFEWQGGSFAGTIRNVDLLRLTGSATKDFNASAVFTNASGATVEMTDTGGLRFLGGSVLFVNATGALFDILSDADFSIFNGGNTFDNDGTLRKSVGSGLSQVSQSGIDFDNSGTVAALVGTIRFSGGSNEHDNGTFSAASGAEIFFDAGIHTITGSISGTADGVIRMNAGATLVDDGSGATIDYGENGFEWQGGNFGGTLTNVDLLRLTTGGTKDLNAAAVLTNASGATVELTDTGTLRFLGGASQFVNAAGALFDVQSDADLGTFNGGNTFTNNGTFQKSGGTDVTIVSNGALAFNNNALVDAQVGTIEFGGSGTHTNGTFEAASGAEVYFNTGTHTITGSISGTADGVIRMNAGATLVDDGSGATIDYGENGFEWQGGNFGGTLTNVDLLRLTTGGTKDLNAAAVLTNASGATVELTDTGTLRFLGGASQFVNAAGALFDVQSDADLGTFNGGNTFTNNGTFQKSGGTDVTIVSNGALAFNNNALVEAQVGTLRFDGSSTHTNGTFETALDAEVYFNTGTHTITGSISGTPAGTIRMDAGAILTGGTLNVGGTGFEWQGGNFGGTLTNVDLLRLTTSGTKDLNAAAVLTNASGATVELTDTGTFRFLGGASQFVNAAGALFDIQSDADFSIFNGGNTFSNFGLLQKTGGATQSLISRSGLTFRNEAGAVVSADSGVLDVNGPFVHDPTATIRGTETFDVAGAGNNLALNGTVAPGTSPGLLSWTGNYDPRVSSRLAIELGGLTPGTGHDQLIVSGNADANGILKISFSSGYTPTIGDSFTIVTAGSVSGTFSSVEEPAGWSFDVAYNASDITITAQATEAVTATLVPNTGPADGPVQIAGTGGTVRYRVTLRNTTGSSQSVQAWVEGLIPNGGVYEDSVLVGPTTVNLNPGQQIGPVALQQIVPQFIAGGAYALRLRIGTFPNTVVDEDAFILVKAAPPPPRTGAPALASADAPGRAAARRSTSNEMWSVVEITNGEPLLAARAVTEAEALAIEEAFRRAAEDDLVAEAKDGGAEEVEAGGDTEGDAGSKPTVASVTLPDAYALHAAYPNPFTTTATLRYDLPEAATATLTVYDLLGRTVAVLVDGEVEAGRHTAMLDGRSLAAGTYVVRFVAGAEAHTQRLTIVR